MELVEKYYLPGFVFGEIYVKLFRLIYEEIKQWEKHLPTKYWAGI
jgi:hypothetical protein